MKTRNFPKKKMQRKLNADYRNGVPRLQRQADEMIEFARSVRTKKDRRSLAGY